jgi:hypothetical protein
VDRVGSVDQAIIVKVRAARVAIVREGIAVRVVIVKARVVQVAIVKARIVIVGRVVIAQAIRASLERLLGRVDRAFANRLKVVPVVP